MKEIEENRGSAVEDVNQSWRQNQIYIQLAFFFFFFFLQDGRDLGYTSPCVYFLRYDFPSHAFTAILTAIPTLI